MGEINSNLLGLIIVSKLQMTALERASMPEEQRSDFYLYIDEFQNFITESIATILSEAQISPGAYHRASIHEAIGR